MEEPKETDLYHNFSRKDLQGLCKKYGLPANKSNSEMATSLILYLEKKNLNSGTICEIIGSDPFPLGTSELQVGVRMNSADNQRRDCRGSASCGGFGNNEFNNYCNAKQNDLQNCKGTATYKASEELGVLTQLCRESNSGAGIPENAFSSVVSSSAVVPSPTFTFDVSCEDGIQLYVDLNSSPSDWIENMKAGVHICHDAHNLKSQSFHQEIGRLCCSEQINGPVPIDSSKKTNNGQLEDMSYPHTTLTGIQVPADQPDGEGSLSSSGLKSLSNAVHSLGNSGEEQAIVSSRLESGTEEQHCGLISRYRREETVATDLDVNIVTQTRMCNFTGNSLARDLNCSGMSEHEGVNVGNGIYQKVPLQQTYVPLDHVLRCSESSTAACMEIQASSCASLGECMENSPSRVGGCLNIADEPQNIETVQCGSIKSVQYRGDVHQIWPVQAVGQSKYVSCSPFMNSLSLDQSDHRREVDNEHGGSSILSKSSRQITEVQTPLASGHRKSRSFFPYQRYEFTENDLFLSSQKAGCKAAGLWKKDSGLYPFSNGGSLDLVVAEQNGVDHCISNQLHELEGGICRRKPTANVEDLGSSKARNGRESSECLNFRDLMDKSWRKPADSEFNGELKRKKHYNSIEDQRKCVKADSESNGELRRKRHFNNVEVKSKAVYTE